MFNSEEIASIIMSVLFVGTFLGIFFFTYASKVENDVVVDQVNYIVSDLANDLQVLPPEIIANLKTQMNNIQQPDLSSADADVEASNKKIMNNAIMMISIFLVSGLILIYIMSRIYGFSILHILKKNLIIITFIGLTEFSFLKFFASNYISADPNAVKLLILNKLSGVTGNIHDTRDMTDMYKKNINLDVLDNLSQQYFVNDDYASTN